MTCNHSTYQRGCTHCRAISAAAAQRRRDAIREGRHRPQVPAGHIRPHLDRLRAEGMAMTVIADRAGISRHTIQRVVSGRREHVVASVADAILAVQPEPICRTVGIHAAGTARRLQALMTKGWNLTAVGERADVPMSTLWHIAVGGTNTVATRIADAVRTVYDNLYATDSTCSRARRTAARHGWAGPGAWDDDTIDDPAGLPNVGEAGADIIDEVAIRRVLDGALPFKALRDAEKVALFRDHLADGGYNRTMRRLRMSASTVQKWRERAAAVEQVAA